jgi:hypothetical protein
LSIYQASMPTKAPVLKYYTVRVSPEVKDNDLDSARKQLESSLFLSVNHLFSQNSNLGISEVLDKVLPLSETVGRLSGGVVIVIQNYGEITAHKIRANITIDTPIEKYKIFSNESFSVISEDKQKGTLEISIERLTAGDDVHIAILFPGAYTVTLIVSRFDTANQISQNHQGATTDLDALAATATAAATRQDNINNLNRVLYFHLENYLDKIQASVFISSDEMQGVFSAAPSDTSKEKDLFFTAFK